MVVDCHDWQKFDLSMLSSLIQCAAECREQGAAFEVNGLSSDLVAEVRSLGLSERLGLAD
jgi:ABC-type transporter Mla MlaB component